MTDDSNVLFIYSYSLLKNASKMCDGHCGYALIASSGKLVRLFGPDSFVKNFREKCDSELPVKMNITDSMLKDCDRDRVITIEDDMTLPFSDYSICYAPILMDLTGLQANAGDNLPYSPTDCRPWNGRHLLGGVALMYEKPHCISTAPALALALADQIFLQLHWYNLMYQDYSDDTCTISLYKNRNKNQILLLSSNAWKLFGISTADHLRGALESVIPVTKGNRIFWEIVNSKRIVTSRNMQLEIAGRRYNVSITTRRSDEVTVYYGEYLVLIQSLYKLNELRAKYSGTTAYYTFENMFRGNSLSFWSCLHRASQVAESDVSVLLTGESGTGKDVIAQAIHNKSNRSTQPFVALNCAAFSKELINSELFGYEGGSFTGANKHGSMGKFEKANHGTLFLDEIGDMPMELQANLLRVIEQKRYMKVGGTKELQADVRIIAASNKDLKSLIVQNKFRLDLYYRLSVVRISIPPLRERLEDILPLAGNFLKQLCEEKGLEKIDFSADAKDFLLHYKWPGNVRELRNLLEGLVSTESSSVITKSSLIRYIDHGHDSADPAAAADISGQMSYNQGPYSDIRGNNYNNSNAGSGSNTYGSIYSNTDYASPEDHPRRRHSRLTMRPDLSEKREEVIHALTISNNNIDRAAALLGISRRTLYRRLHEFGLMQ